MTDLSNLHCSPVTTSTPQLNQREVAQYLAQLQGWRNYEKGGELRLEKEFLFKDFNQAIAFTNRVAQVANEEDHHPMLLTEWGKVTVTWWTHKIHGLHLNDFIMAAKTDALYTNTSR
jgi:4a-hydroxytetrahydrobiopterin dehydratase